MFLNNLRVSWRNLCKNKTYTLINVLGLTAGIAAVLLIYQMITYELSFNKNFRNYDRIVRVISTGKDSDGGEDHSVCVPAPAGEALVSSIAQFDQKSRVKETWATLTVPNLQGGAPSKKFNTTEEYTAFFVEPDFFQIFDFQWLAGNPETAVSNPNTIVLTKSWAIKCFDRWENAIGNTVLLDNLYPVLVTGVVEDLPVNCDFTMPYLVSYATLKGKEDYFFQDDGDWDSCSSNNQVYATLKDPSQMSAALAAVAKVGEKEYVNKNGKRTKTHALQPLSDLHYDERYHNSGTHIIPKSRLKVLASIGVLILALACFNFINLATAQASLRAKEVGVRKTLGGNRGQLVGQFMTETGILVGISVLMGANLATIAVSLLKYVSRVPDVVPFMSNPSVWLFLLLMAVTVTLLAGLYPSLALAGFQPVKALKINAQKTLSGGAGLRKSLVVLQFVIAQGLIIGAIITILQLNYIRSRDLGFSKDLVYTFSFGSDSLSIARQGALRDALLQIPAVESVSFSSDQPASTNTWNSDFRYANRPESEAFSTTLKFTDDHYQETYGIRLLAGRWLAPSDTMREVVLNQSMIKKLGINDPKEAIGEIFHLWGSRNLRIVGIAEDFHTHSFRQEHLPLALTMEKQFLWEAGVKIRPGDIAATTASIQKAFDAVLPEQVFSGKFLDERIARFYEDDQRLSATCKGFGLLAILISCLGLFGLATHAAAQRVKEIGIRKVLGATTGSIVRLLSKDFLTLVILSLVIASPLAYYFMEKWLQDFAYRIEIHWSVFVLAGVVAVVVAFFTVSFQSIRVALANPVKSLRAE
jgi:predicted permease